LCSFIPPGVKSVLDAGCGTGGNALKLKARGYEVEGLSPDPYQREKFTQRTGGLPFHLARFQEFTPQRRYDLVFMSESCQYVPLGELFPAAARAAEPGPAGHLLVSDYFPLLKDGSRMTKSGHALDAFLAEAQKNGFEKLREEDVTARVAPTLDLAREWVERYAIPAARLAAETLAEKRPWLYRVGKWLLRKRVAKLDEQRVLLDSAEFRRVKRYRVFLFRAPAVRPAPTAPLERP
jgi:MPBQ/MSBQ methyltransferase